MRLLLALSGISIALLNALFASAQPVVRASSTPSPTPSASPSFSASPIPSASAIPSPSAAPSPVTVYSPPAVSQRTVYFSRLRPLNNSGVWADVMIVLDDNSVGALVRAIGLQPGMQHSQYVESGTLCPDQSADQNNDGYIDAVEAAAVTGSPFLTLGFSDGTFPVPSEGGKLNFIASLPSPAPTTITFPVSSSTPSSSPNPTFSSSSYALSSTPSLNNLGGLAVVINGVSPNTQLPSSVQGVNPTADLPVACGRLRQNLE
jgi:hypothetical protein